MKARPDFERLTRLTQTSTKTFPGIYLTLGALLISVCFFAAIAEDVSAGEPLTIIDVRFSAWVHAHQSAALTVVMRLISQVHSLWFVGAAAFVVSVYWWAKRLRDRAFILLAVVFGGMLLNFLLKEIFLRARPRFDPPLPALTTYSFPSGHTLTATVFYGVLGWFIVSRSRNWASRLFGFALAAIMILLVGFSRIYLGAHYPSDVLGAIAEGLAWLAFCLIAAQTVKWRRDRAHKVDVR
ncbi:MAG: phosphatase PAP2 family protein [Acidobacteriota bacterium]